MGSGGGRGRWCSRCYVAIPVGWTRGGRRAPRTRGKRVGVTSVDGAGQGVGRILGWRGDSRATRYGCGERRRIEGGCEERGRDEEEPW